MASGSSNLRKAVAEATLGLKALAEMAELLDARDALVAEVDRLRASAAAAQSEHDDVLARLQAEMEKTVEGARRTTAAAEEQIADLERQKATISGWLTENREAIARERSQHQAALAHDVLAHEETLGRIHKAKLLAEAELVSYQDRLKALNVDLAGSLGRVAG